MYGGTYVHLTLIYYMISFENNFSNQKNFFYLIFFQIQRRNGVQHQQRAQSIADSMFGHPLHNGMPSYNERSAQWHQPHSAIAEDTATTQRWTERLIDADSDGARHPPLVVERVTLMRPTDSGIGLSIVEVVSVLKWIFN